MPGVYDPADGGIESRRMRENPICDLVDNETFIRLYDLGLLNEIALRNVALKKAFARLRQEKNSTEAIAELARKEFRSFSHVRKIIYTSSPLDELVPGKDGGPFDKLRAGPFDKAQGRPNRKKQRPARPGK